MDITEKNLKVNNLQIYPKPKWKSAAKRVASINTINGIMPRNLIIFFVLLIINVPAAKNNPENCTHKTNFQIAKLSLFVKKEARKGKTSPVCNNS